VTNLKNYRLWLRAAGEVTFRVICIAAGIAVANHFFHYLGH
jgi:hypothetical protein